MKKLLIVTGSVRNGRATDNVLAQVQAELASYPDLAVTVADFKAIPLPFIDTEVLPSAEDFTPADKNVATWLKMLGDADAVLIISPEYNHSYTPVLKNAIDWAYSQWHDKPVGLVGFGWVGGARAIKHLRDVLASNINARTLETEANLRFMKEINTDGTAIDSAAGIAINDVIEAVKAAVLEPATQAV